MVEQTYESALASDLSLSNALMTTVNAPHAECRAEFPKSTPLA